MGSLTSEFYRPCQACRNRLDLMCGDPVARGSWIEVRPADPRFDRNAITIRLGGRSRRSPSKVEVQVGSFLQRALFLAAVLTTFVL